MRLTMLPWVALFLVAPAIAGAAGPQPQDVYNRLSPRYQQMLNAASLVQGGDGITAWTRDGSGLWHVSGGRLRWIDPRTGTERIALDAERLRAALSEQFGAAADAASLPLEKMILGADGRIRFRWGEVPVTLDPVTHAVETHAETSASITPTGTFPRYLFMYSGYPSPDTVSPDGTRVASVLADGNIGIRTLAEEEFHPLTTNAAERFEWDIDTHRISIGSTRAVATVPWSPEGHHLLAMRIDRRELPQVPEFRPLTDPLPEIVHRDVFPAGGPYYRYHPAIIDTVTGIQTPVKIDFGTDHVMFLSWADDGNTVYLARLNRRFSRLALIAIDADTGEAQTILTEEDPRGGLRNPHAVFYAGNIGFKLLPAGQGFLWLSERNGWNHIYHHAVSGKRLRQLTKGHWRVENIVAFDAEARQVFFTGRPDPKHIYDVHVMAVPLAGGAVRQLSQGRGTHHQPMFSPDRSMFIDRFESFETPPRIELRRSDGSLIAVIDAADASALYATGWQPPEEFTVAGPDGVSIRGVMYLPFDFDPTKRYPVIDYIYGGPQTLWSYPSFVAPGEAVGANLPLAMAQLGYVVLKMDTVGTPGRSRTFQIRIADKWGPGISGDHAEVIRALGRQYPWLDTENVGIFGHSWGGLNVLHALASHGDFFKAGVASAPGFGIPAVPDGFMEAYLGSPAQNPSAWGRADIMATITDIRRPLLLVSGTQDLIFYLSVLRASNALVKAGIQHEVALAPGQGHGIYGPYADYLAEKEVRFFLRHIPPAKAVSRP